MRACGCFAGISVNAILTLSLLSNGCRGMLDFVRRRKLRKVAYFRPDHFLSHDIYSKCDFCDSKAVNLISVSVGVLHNMYLLKCPCSQSIF